jgi:hypothetical protein
VALDIGVSGSGVLSLGYFVSCEIFGPADCPVPFWSVGLSSTPAGVPTGGIVYIGGSSDFDVVLGDPVSTVASQTDHPAGCFFTACVITGTWALVGSIPEPASLGLLAPGVLGLAALRQRRSAPTRALSSFRDYRDAGVLRILSVPA